MPRVADHVRLIASGELKRAGSTGEGEVAHAFNLGEIEGEPMGLAEAAIGTQGERSALSTSAAFGREHYCHKSIACKFAYRPEAGATGFRSRAPISAVTLRASVSSYVSSLSKTQ